MCKHQFTTVPVRSLHSTGLPIRHLGALLTRSPIEYHSDEGKDRWTWSRGSRKRAEALRLCVCREHSSKLFHQPLHTLGAPGQLTHTTAPSFLMVNRRVFVSAPGKLGRRCSSSREIETHCTPTSLSSSSSFNAQLLVRLVCL